MSYFPLYLAYLDLYIIESDPFFVKRTLNRFGDLTQILLYFNTF
ncbi:hypothetical protein CLOSTHATH_00242 [Hungatella hathewayi DSM 13479]|uniref:Uncharacterized protein n=1 Tax=Hungatella hathewayi DSM 13479 TaxID=566550 RepID=D3A9H0_9FIRM|nr:hypothetical protein CLOSTHATH_00242 [Hungatella hathewayi DSM 13479]